MRSQVLDAADRKSHKLGKPAVEALLLVPDVFVLLVRLMLDKDVPADTRTLIGGALAYFILPFAVGFLLAFADDVLVANLAAGPYFDFVTTMFLAFGLIMEFPIVLFGLSRVGIVTSARLVSSRRVIILGIAIFATAITPGGDIVSPIALGGTMYLLFEATVFFIRRSGK